MLDGFVTNECRWLCRFFGIAVKQSRKEMSDHIYWLLVARSRALYTSDFITSELFNNWFCFGSCFDAPSVPLPDSVAYSYATAELSDFYQLLAGLLKGSTDLLSITEGDPTYELLWPLSSGSPDRITIYTNRARVLHGDRDAVHDIFATLPNNVQARKAPGDAVAKK